MTDLRDFAELGALDHGLVVISTARVDGKVCLRPCVVNYRTTDDDVRAFVDVTLDVGRSLAS